MTNEVTLPNWHICVTNRVLSSWLAHLCDQQVLALLNWHICMTNEVTLPDWHICMTNRVLLSQLAHLREQWGIALGIKRGEAAWYYWLTVFPWENPQDTLVAFFILLHAMQTGKNATNLMLMCWVKNPPLWLDFGSRCLRDSSYDILSPNAIFSRPTDGPWPSFFTTLSIRYTCRCEQKQKAGNGSDVIFILVALKCCHAGTIGAI